MNKCRIIGIAGHKYSGKDTLGDYLCRCHGYTRLAFADTLKEVVGTMFSLNNEQLHGNLKEEADPYWGVSPRKLLQFIGTELFRDNMGKLLPEIGEDIWCRVLERKINLIPIEKRKIVITDVRFPNEEETIRRLGGIIIGLKRDTGHVDTHRSEDMIDNIKCDYNFTNNGSKDDLYRIVVRELGMDF